MLTCSIHWFLCFQTLHSGQCNVAFGQFWTDFLKMFCSARPKYSMKCWLHINVKLHISTLFALLGTCFSMLDHMFSCYICSLTFSIVIVFCTQALSPLISNKVGCWVYTYTNTHTQTHTHKHIQTHTNTTTHINKHTNIPIYFLWGRRHEAEPLNF